MARCPICGQMLDWIEVEDGGRVADDCSRCTPRLYEVEEFRDEIIDVEDYE